MDSMTHRPSARAGRRFDPREFGRALVLAAVVASVVTGVTVETDALDRSAVATPVASVQGADHARPQAVVHHDATATTWTATPPRGLAPSDLWAADESDQGQRPEAAH